MKATLHFATGRTELLSFKKFLFRIPRKTVKGKYASFNIHKMVAVTNWLGWVGFIEPASFERRDLMLIRSDANILKGQIISQLKAFEPQTTGLFAIEDACAESYMNFGDPKCLVRLGPGLWMACNPKNFILYENTLGQGVAVIEPTKVVLAKIARANRSIDQIRK